MGELEIPESLSERIQDLLLINTLDSVTEAWQLFMDSEELVYRDLLFELDSARSAWGLRPSTSRKELDRRSKVTSEQVGPTSPFGKINALYVAWEEKMAEWSAKAKETNAIEGVENLQVKIEMYRSQLRRLLEATQMLAEIEALLPECREYFIYQSMFGNIIRFGEELAKRIKPNEELFPEVQAILDENRDTLERYKQIQKDAESAMETAITELCEINADVLQMYAVYQSKKAEIGRQALDAVIAHTVSVAITVGTPEDEN